MKRVVRASKLTASRCCSGAMKARVLRSNAEVQTMKILNATPTTIPNRDGSTGVDEQQPALEGLVQEDQVRDAYTCATDDKREDGPDSDALLTERRRDGQHPAEADVDRRTGSAASGTASGFSEPRTAWRTSTGTTIPHAGEFHCTASARRAPPPRTHRAASRSWTYSHSRDGPRSRRTEESRERR